MKTKTKTKTKRCGVWGVGNEDVEKMEVYLVGATCSGEVDEATSLSETHQAASQQKD
jgi:hypothetical protein